MRRIADTTKRVERIISIIVLSLILMIGVTLILTYINSKADINKASNDTLVVNTTPSVETAYKISCAGYTNKDIINNIDKLITKDISFVGRVASIDDTAKDYSIFTISDIGLSDDGGVWYVVDDTSAKFIPGDMVIVYGSINGLSFKGPEIQSRYIETYKE